MDIMLLILLLGGALAVVLLVIGFTITARSERSLVEERLGRYLEEEQTAPKIEPGERASPIGDIFNRLLQGSQYGEGLSKSLARADLKLKASEYVALMVISSLGTGFIAWFFGGQTILVGIIGLVAGVFLPGLYVGYQQGQRLNRFNDQLADMLNLMVNGLRAGYSTMQAMEAVAKELPPPICDEFRRVVQEMQLGLPMERALENLLRRIPSDDLDLVITAMNVQREVGGNLSEILETISHTIRERVRIKGEIRVLTSQVVYSGRFLAMMPLFIFITLWFLNRPYMMEFFNPPYFWIFPLGSLGLVIGAIMIAFGYLFMMQIANIEV